MTRPPEVTAPMLDALRAIRAAGGEAHPRAGGWWRGADDRILFYSSGGSITSSMISRLTTRGLLEKIEDPDWPHWRSKRRLTEVGRTLADEH